MKNAKKKSLINSILLSSVGALICMNLVIVLLFTIFIRSDMVNKAKSEVYYRVAEQSSDMNAWMTKHVTIAEDLALTAKTTDLRGDELRKYLSECILNVSSSIMDCYVSWADESPHMECAVFVPAADYVPEQRGWYKSAKAANKTIITDPYIDAFTGKIVITVATPIKNNAGTMIGCAGLDIDITELLNLAKDMRADDDGYAILADASGNVVVDSRHEINSHHLEGGNEIVAALSDVLPFYSPDEKYSDENILEGTGPDGVSRFYPIVELGKTGWKLAYAARYDEVNAEPLTTNLMIIGVGVAAVILGTIFFKIKFTLRLNPLRDIVGAINEMSEGNFDIDIKYDMNDEIGQLAESMRVLCKNNNEIIADLGHILRGMEQGDLTTMSADANIYKGDYFKLITSIRNFRGRINKALSNINDISDSVLSEANQVSSGAQALSQGTTEQASSVEELAATIQEVTVQINNNASAAKDAMAKTNEAGEEMAHATEKMNELIAAMNETKECSDKIGRIIQSIEDIAFQTNILALNASIEAARAGEAGKGFAVVAEEVRNLAGKSAEAASNTNVLIENTIKSVENGNALVSRVAEVMDTVANAARQVAQLNTGICESSAQIASSVEQINMGVGQISGVVQMSAASAEESAAASEELSGQANTLKGLVDEFVLK